MRLPDNSAPLLERVARRGRQNPLCSLRSEQLLGTGVSRPDPVQLNHVTGTGL